MLPARATRVYNSTTMLQFYAYRIAVRNEFSPILHAKKLFQQYSVDAYCRVEGNNLDYLRHNQATLRADKYTGLMDFVNTRADERGLQPGRVVILPSSFSGSPRAMTQNYQDAMAVIARFGRPDLFLTFTCNPKCQEITTNLCYSEQACDRPDLVSRVFKMKLDELIKDLVEKGALGKIISYVYVIEFQKRGLPHVHLLIHLQEEDKLRDSDDIDAAISAEIPDPDEQSELYNVVKTCMVHGPCGLMNANSPCMDNGICTKDFPKDFCHSTIAEVNGYPKYRRRNNGRVIRVRDHDVDNQWIVPYNPWLSIKYKAHINLESCSSVKAVKYLYKYIYKGHDCANIEINERLDHDEISTFLDTRYVSAPEAVWRLSSFKMHAQSHAVIRLPVHLPDNQMVYFRENDVENAVDRAAQKDSQLTAWFKLNQDNVLARQYLYPDFPYHFVFNKRNGKWNTRQCGGNKIISRMYAVSPGDGERFYLRLLLLHVRGATSFLALRTVDDNVAETFRDACSLRGLLQDDTEWHNTMTEASNFHMPCQLRQLFAVILTHCMPSDPLALWTAFKDSMMEDYTRGFDAVQAEQSVLADIHVILQQSGKTLVDYQLPSLDELPVEEGIDSFAEAIVALEIRPNLNQEQLQIADAVLDAVCNVHNNINQNVRLFYLDGPAGTGKTFTYNYLISELLGRGMEIRTAAFTGIASTLLKGGMTVHKLFRLPVPILDKSTCNISPTSTYAAKLRRIDLFLLDESIHDSYSCISCNR